MSKLKIYIIGFLLTVFNYGISQPTVSMADSAYNQGNFSEAIAYYNEIANNQGVSAALLYNLGNAYLKADDLGNAMLCYQRAKQLDPSNKMINSNLNYLKEKVDDANKAEQKGKKRKVTEDTPNFFQTVHKSIAEDQSSDSWAGWAAAFFLIFSGCAALYLFNSSVLLKKIGFFGGIGFLGLSMILLVCAYSAASSYNQQEYGIVISFKAVLKTEPNTKSDSESNEGVLTRGTKIRIISEETNADGEVSWFKVRLNSDYIGWLEADQVELI